MSIPVRLENGNAGGARQPVAMGLPFRKGDLWDDREFSLVDPRGLTLPSQSSALARWSDGSIKWLLVEALLGPSADGAGQWTVRRIGRRSSETLRVDEGREVVTIETGAATFRIGRDGRPLLQATIEGRDPLEAGGARIALTDPSGRVAPTRPEVVRVECRGPLRTTVRFEGRFEGRARCRFIVRFDFFAGSGLVCVRLTLHNPERSRHAGGMWDLGDPGSIFFRDLSLELPLAGTSTPEVVWAAEPGQPPRSMAGRDLEIYQDSSGGENWQSRNHVNGGGVVPCTFRGYRVRAGGPEEHGLRANPTIAVRGERGRVAAAIPEFWQQFPKALEVESRTLRARLFPAQYGDLFELQGGERKTHTLWLDFGEADDRGGLDWVHRPVRIQAMPEWYEGSGAIPHLLTADPAGRLEAELAGIVDGPRSFAARREAIDEYGWRHYGEVYADHEAAYYTGEPPIISHYNNQYDVVYGLILQYLRTGDVRWFEVVDPLSRHAIDIDVYHTSRDKSAYNGGLFWHTDHYRDAATCTHRAFSRSNRPCGGGPYGGGPCDEHNYTTGLLHYYYLTGDADARDAVLSMADWVINADDGRKNILGLLDPGATGSASRTAEWDYHGPGRGAGNSINALLDGWLLSGDRAYLQKAEALIRRTIHPEDDIAARGLLRTEARWSYTVYLSNLARYLAVKAETGELDAMYAYGRAGLIHYTHWMLEHEVPYFDRPEELEYPTETWAAQEFRKANVLRLAAPHAGEPLRGRLLARGEELADRAWADLQRFESRDVTRSVAILMREGVVDAYYRSRPVEPSSEPVGRHEFGRPETFVAQKDRVRAVLSTPGGLVRSSLRVAAAMLGKRPW